MSARKVMLDPQAIRKAAMTATTRSTFARVRPLAGSFVATLIDPAADPDARQGAGRRLGMAEGIEYRAVAVAGIRTAAGRAHCDVPAGQPGLALHWISPRRGLLASVVPSSATQACGGALPLCAGIGPAVSVSELPSSFEGAEASLRFTASGSRIDPGPRVVRFDDLGALVLIAGLGDAARAGNPDLDRIAAARHNVEWAMHTMVAIAQGRSLRHAAKTMFLHHSTLAERVVLLEELLGYSLREPAGRRRLDIALTIDRLRLNSDL